MLSLNLCWVPHELSVLSIALLELVLITAGEPGEGKRAVWIVARQHPGESMAEWFMEGMLHALLDPYHGLSKELLKKAVFYIVRITVGASALRRCLDLSWSCRPYHNHVCMTMAMRQLSSLGA